MRLLLRVLLALGIASNTGYGQDRLVWVSTPVGQMQVHERTVKKMREAGGRFVSFATLRSQLESENSPRVIYTPAQGHLGEARILAQEFRQGRAPITVITDSFSSLRVLLEAKKLSERNDIRIIAVVAEVALQNAYLRFWNDVDILVYRSELTRALDPYATPTNITFYSDRTDAYGRDLLSKFLFELSNSGKISALEILDLGGRSLNIVFDILTLARFEGFRAGSVGCVIRLFDLALDGRFGGWGHGVFHFVTSLDRIRSSLNETSLGTKALEYLTFDLRFYEGTSPSDIEPWELSKAWIEGRIATNFIAIGPHERKTREFQELLNHRLVLLWSSVLSQRALEKAMDNNHPKLEEGLRPLVVPHLGKAQALSWEQLSFERLPSEAFQTIYFENLLFESGSTVLSDARHTGEPVSFISLMRNDGRFQVRVGMVGRERASQELAYFNLLNRQFHELLKENKSTASGLLYNLRRRTFAHGINFGGRWEPHLKTCWHLLRDSTQASK